MKRTVCIALVSAQIFCFCNFGFAQGGSRAYIYVDANAEPGGDGEITTPFATPEQARDAIREMKKNGEYPDGGVTVYFRGGEYKITQSFTLDREDSGTAEAPITYEAYPLEEVTFVGGTNLKLKDFAPAQSGNFDESLRGKIYSCNLLEHNVEPYDRLYVIGHGASAFFGENEKYGWLSEEEKAQLSPPEIFYNNEPMTLSRYPNVGDGYMKIDTVIRAGDSIGGWAEPPTSQLYVPEEYRHHPPQTPIFTVNDEHIKKWGNAKYAWVNGWWYQ